MSDSDSDQLVRRWRLILGKEADPENRAGLSKREKGVDKALAGIYGDEKRGGFKRSYPTVHTWLEDVRSYFPSEVVSLIQIDAIERLGLIELIAEKEVAEQIEPDVKLISAILALRGSLPEKVKESARIIIDRIVQQIEQNLFPRTEKAIMGYLSHKSSRKTPTISDLDWRKTLLKNLRHYDPSTGKIIPEKLYSFDRERKKRKQIIVLVDSSASMSNSLVYAGIYACVLAGLPSIKTNLVLFDNEVADLSNELDDPTELIFGLELGGGTFIPKALEYARKLIEDPAQTVLFLISDLEEGYQPGQLVPSLEFHQNRGTQCICLTALSDDGRPDYDREMAANIAALQIPVFGCTPEHFPELLTSALLGKSPASASGMFVPG